MTGMDDPALKGAAIGVLCEEIRKYAACVREALSRIPSSFSDDDTAVMSWVSEELKWPRGGVPENLKYYADLLAAKTALLNELIEGGEVGNAE